LKWAYTSKSLYKYVGAAELPRLTVSQQKTDEIATKRVTYLQ